MNLLIDGCLFTPRNPALGSGDSAQSREFWREVIPRLAKHFSDGRLYFLNRLSKERFLDNPAGLSILQAPGVDAAQFPLEQRRLAALCRELHAHIFISTQYTHAAPAAKTLFALDMDFPYLESIDAASLLARDHLIKSADLCLARSADGANYLATGYGIPKSKTRILSGGKLIDWDKIAEQIVAAVRDVLSPADLAAAPYPVGPAIVERT